MVKFRYTFKNIKSFVFIFYYIYKLFILKPTTIGNFKCNVNNSYK